MKAKKILKKLLGIGIFVLALFYGPYWIGKYPMQLNTWQALLCIPASWVLAGFGAWLSHWAFRLLKDKPENDN